MSKCHRKTSGFGVTRNALVPTFLGIALLGSTPAIACTINAHPKARAQAMERYWARVKDAHAIVYGVVERDIDNTSSSGVLKVLHTYYGNEKPGESIRLRRTFSDRECGYYEIHRNQERNTYGVAVLYKDPATGDSLFPGFLYPGEIDRLVSSRMIRRVSSQPPVPNAAIFSHGPVSNLDELPPPP